MRWGRAIAGGVMAELLLIVAVMPGFALGSEPIVIWTAVIGSPVMTFLAALWVSRRLESRFVLHGAVVGLTACLIYLVPIIAAGSTSRPLLGGARTEDSRRRRRRDVRGAARRQRSRPRTRGRLTVN